MGIDSSIYFQQQQPDLAGSIANGMKLKDMMRQRKLQDQEDQFNSALRDSYQPDEAGKLQFNQQRMGDLIKINPQKAAEFQQQQAQQKSQQQALDLKNVKEKFELGGQVANGVTDQATHEAAVRFLQSHGFGKEELPGATYDPEAWKNFGLKSMSFKDKIAQHLSERERDQADKRIKIDEETLGVRKGELAAKHDENRIKRDQMAGEKVDKLAKDLKKDLDPDASRTGNFGQISARLQSGDRMKTLVGAFHDGNLPPAQVEELALGMANMISGSNGAARSQVEALVPHSAMGDTQKFKAWLLNEPYGANQQKFVEMMGHTIDREMDLANKQLNEIRAKRLGAHERFKKMAPDQYKAMLADYGMGLDSKGKPTETKEWQGITYVKDGDHWVPQGI